MHRHYLKKGRDYAWALLSSITNFGAVLGPVCTNRMYCFTVNQPLPNSDGYPFIFSAILVLICLIPLSKGLKIATAGHN